jgi:hypothetical protein
MPYESLTCPKCGSGDCQEVKPGTHFCNYCDNVFKYLPPTAVGGQVASCATCGVVATGLCLTCNQYFCSGHQAVIGNTRYTDWCTACLKDENDKQNAEYARQREEAVMLSRRSGRVYLRRSARAELKAAGVPLVKLYYVSPRQVARFGMKRTIENYNWGQVGTGWLLGDFDWTWNGTSLKSQTVFFAERPKHDLLGSLPFGAKDPQVYYYGMQDIPEDDRHNPIFGRVTEKLVNIGYSLASSPGELETPYEELGATIQLMAGTTRQHR